MTDLWNKRREKLEQAVKDAAMDLFAHMGCAAAFRLDLGSGLSVQAGPDDAATLRQQAGRVDEDTYAAIGKAFREVLTDPSVAWRNTGAKEFIDRVRDKTAALAQNTQAGEAVAFDVELEREINRLRGFFADPCPAWVSRHIEWMRANASHAERARVPEMLDWAVSRWMAEVSNRPLVNKNRRSLDDAWRQVIRHCGGDDAVLCGPRHDDLLAAAPTQRAEVKS